MTLARRAAAAAAFFALAAVPAPDSTAGEARVVARIIEAPLAYTYLDPQHRRPDGTFEYRTFGVWIHVVSSRDGGGFTKAELRSPDVRLAGTGSREAHLLGFERALKRSGRRRGVCFHARFIVSPGGSPLGEKRPGDRAMVVADLSERLVARRVASIAEGNVAAQRANDRARIRKAGCRPPRRFGR